MKFIVQPTFNSNAGDAVRVQRSVRTELASIQFHIKAWAMVQDGGCIHV